MAKSPKLTDLQLILLSTATQRDDGNVFPLADSIKAKTAESAKAITALLKHELVIEQPETVLVRVWREDSDQRIGLAITDTGRALIDGNTADWTRRDSGPASAPPASPAPRGGSKAEAVVALLRRDGGVTTAELIAATGWLPHTTRAALTGLRKKGHAIERSKRDDVTCYRISAAQ